MTGDRRIIYPENGAEKAVAYDWYGVAPAGQYTKWNGLRPKTLDGAQLLKNFELAQKDHVIHSQSVEAEDWPYLTFNVRSYNPRAR